MLHWHLTENDRQMPWKGERDPYRIWLSEIMLQQTRVEQGMPYYERFVRQFPTIQQLAEARDEDVFKLWEGLGYYSRCRNLLTAARQVWYNLGGSFPQDYDQLLELKGVGPYTAAAIASFAFGLPCAVTDGNVIRILARFFGIGIPFDSTEGQKLFRQTARQMLPADRSAAYNQAIMDFGATVCKPKNPECHVCPLQKQCIAYKTNMVDRLPLKASKIAKRTRFFQILMIKGPAGWLVQQRLDKDIWKHLHEFVLTETNKSCPLDAGSVASFGLEKTGLRIKAETIWDEQEQHLTHQIIKARFALCTTQSRKKVDGYQWVSEDTIGRLAFPKLMKEQLERLKSHS
jgi:A/G-specific adenine glycosylase